MVLVLQIELSSKERLSLPDLMSVCDITISSTAMLTKVNNIICTFEPNSAIFITN